MTRAGAIATILTLDMRLREPSTEDEKAPQLLERMTDALSALTNQPLYVPWQALGAQRVGRALDERDEPRAARHALDLSAHLGARLGASALYTGR